MKNSLCVACILFALLSLLTGNVYSSNENAPISRESTLSEKLVETAGEVLLGAVEFGLDWSGEKLLGSKGWKGFKRIFNPVVVKLQEKFPALKFGKVDDAQSIEVAQEAVRYLHRDPELQNLLVQGFMNLNEGQQEILDSVDRLGKLIEANHNEEIRLLQQMNIKLSGTAKLPVKIDMSDTIERKILLSKIRAKREGTEFDQASSRSIALGVTMLNFTWRVLESGDAFVRYEAHMANEKWYATPYSRYFDKKGRLCRKIRTDIPVIWEPGKRTTYYGPSCLIEGDWTEVEMPIIDEYFEQ